MPTMQFYNVPLHPPLRSNHSFIQLAGMSQCQLDTVSLCPPWPAEIMPQCRVGPGGKGKFSALSQNGITTMCATGSGRNHFQFPMHCRYNTMCYYTTMQFYNVPLHPPLRSNHSFIQLAGMSQCQLDTVSLCPPWPAEIMPFGIPINAILTLLHEVRVRNGMSRQKRCWRWMRRRTGGGLQENICHILI